MMICVIDRPSRDILLCIGTQPLVGGAVRWNKRWSGLSGGLLTCLMLVSSNMFDRWYPEMFWHVWCTRMLLVAHCNVFVMFEHVLLLSQAFYFASGGMLPCLMPVSSNMFDRWYPDMFWHVWCTRMLLVAHCNVFVMFEHVPLLSQAFYLDSGGMLPCLTPVYLYMCDRWYPDMFWHVYTGMFMLQCLIIDYCLFIYV